MGGLRDHPHTTYGVERRAPPLILETGLTSPDKLILDLINVRKRDKLRVQNLRPVDLIHFDKPTEGEITETNALNTPAVHAAGAVIRDAQYRPDRHNEPAVIAAWKTLHDARDEFTRSLARTRST